MKGISFGDDFASRNEQRLAKQKSKTKLNGQPFKFRTDNKSLKRQLPDSQFDKDYLFHMNENKEDDDYLTLNNDREERNKVGSSKNKHGNTNFNCKGEDDIDPDYKMFLDNVREDGTSYILEVSRDNEIPLFIKYESEGNLHDENEAQFPILRNSSKLPYSLKRQDTKTLTKFLCKADWDSKVSGMECDKSVEFKKADNCFDSEVFVSSKASDFDQGNHNTFKTSNVFDSMMDEGEIGTSQDSQHWEKLVHKLREPYNQKEYEQLWHDINEKKQKEGCRNLRGSLISYKKDECSLSYLEEYNELKELIDAVQSDKHKVLNLLRVFFFWLENLVHHDEFPPWMDKACLAVMPGSS